MMMFRRRRGSQCAAGFASWCAVPRPGASQVSVLRASLVRRVRVGVPVLLAKSSLVRVGVLLASLV